jgi:hypothetical protein
MIMARASRGRNRVTTSSAVGVSGGTGFAGIVLLMQDGVVKSILLILSPAITVIINRLWHVFTEVIDERVADWRIWSQRRKAEKLYERLKSDASVDPSVRDKAKATLDALKLLEVEIAKRRVEAIVSS